jgi:hypothetical protein
MDISPVGTKIQHLSHFMSKFSLEKRKNADRFYGKTLKKKKKKKSQVAISNSRVVSG